MEHIIGIAFWIVTLSGFLQAKSLPITDLNIQSMQRNIQCLSNSRFYAPTNVKEQCITTALDCVMRELKGAVKVECNDPHEDIDSAIDFLDLKIQEISGKGQALTTPSECVCEQWSQTSFSEFLNEMVSLLQMRNFPMEIAQGISPGQPLQEHIQLF